MLAIRDIVTNITEPLPNFDVTCTDSEEEGLSLKIEGLRETGNAEGFDLIKNLNILIWEENEYEIYDYNKWPDGDKMRCEASADHRAYCDLDNVFIREKKTGTFTITQLLTQALSGTGYTFQVDTTNLAANVQVENFGWAHAKDLVKDIAEKFDAEWKPAGKTLIFAQQIGSNRDEILRYSYNMNDPKININSRDFKTYIEGYGKQNEDGSYVVTSSYTSPLAAIYGKKDATPLEDERYTNLTSLNDALKRQLNDSLPISLTLTAVELEEMGLKDVKRGDTVWCVIQPLGIDMRIRVVSKEEYSDPTKSPVFTFGKIQRSATTIVASYNKATMSLSTIVGEDGKIKSTAVNTTGISIPISQTTGNLPGSRVDLVMPTYSRATALTDGLMSSDDFVKLASISVGENGQVIVDLSSIEETVQEQQQQITNLEQRVAALETPSS